MRRRIGPAYRPVQVEGGRASDSLPKKEAALLPESGPIESPVLPDKERLRESVYAMSTTSPAVPTDRLLLVGRCWPRRAPSRPAGEGTAMTAVVTHPPSSRFDVLNVSTAMCAERPTHADYERVEFDDGTVRILGTLPTDDREALLL